MNETPPNTSNKENNVVEEYEGIEKVQSTFVRITGIDLMLRASRLESGEPDAKKKRYGHQCQSHATESDHFFQGCGNKFFIFGIEIKIRDLDSQ